MSFGYDLRAQLLLKRAIMIVSTLTYLSLQVIIIASCTTLILIAPNWSINSELHAHVIGSCKTQYAEVFTIRVFRI